jgi:excisionase family DNA binding protein
MHATERKPLLTVTEVAARLNLSRWSVYRRVADGQLPAVRIGGALRFDEQELENWIFDDGGDE